MRRLLVAMALCLASAVGAAPLSPSDKAMLQGAISVEEAIRKGREGDAATLRRIIALRDPGLVQAFGSGMYSQVMPAEVEELVVQHFQDEVMGPSLRRMPVPFRTRALFDLHWARASETWLREDPSFAALERAQVPGIEEELMRLSEKQIPQDHGLTSLAVAVARRLHPAALPALHAALRTPLRGSERNRALELLLAYPAPEVWMATGRELDRLKTDGAISIEQHQRARALLDPLLRDPAAELQRRRLREAGAVFTQRKRELPFDQARIQALKSQDPAAYLAEATRYNEAQEALAREIDIGLPPSTAVAWFELGLFARFRVRDVPAAIRIFKRAAKLGHDLSQFALADTLQFAVKDRAGAAGAYREVLARVRKHELRPGGFFGAEGTLENAWWQAWLAYEIAFLTQDRPPQVSISEAQVGGFFDAMLERSVYVHQSFAPEFAVPIHRTFGGQGEQRRASWRRARINYTTIPHETLGQRLEALPPSRIALLAVLGQASALKDPEAILAHFRRHDPSGYWSACVFANVSYLDGLGVEWKDEAVRTIAAELLPGLTVEESPKPLSVAAGRFLKARGLEARPLRVVAR